MNERNGQLPSHIPHSILAVGAGLFSASSLSPRPLILGAVAAAAVAVAEELFPWLLSLITAAVTC